MRKNLLCLFLILNLCLNLFSSTKIKTRNMQVDVECADLGLVNSTLSASCKDDAGEFKNTSINLDDCFGASNGNIVNGARNYSASCNFCYIFFFSLVCTCQKEDNSVDNNIAINLAQYMKNVNGTLTC